MIPLDWIGRARPLPGRVWVRRVEQPRQVGLIILPDGAGNYRRITRSAEALVVAENSGHFQPGTRVLLAEIVGREIQFGFRGEVKVLDIAPFQVLATLSESPDRPLGLQPHLSRDVDGEGVEASLQEPGFEEGSPEGLL